MARGFVYRQYVVASVLILQNPLHDDAMFWKCFLHHCVDKSSDHIAKILFGVLQGFFVFNLIIYQQTIEYSVICDAATSILHIWHIFGMCFFEFSNICQYLTNIAGDINQMNDRVRACHATHSHACTESHANTHTHYKMMHSVHALFDSVVFCVGFTWCIYSFCHGWVITHIVS